MGKMEASAASTTRGAGALPPVGIERISQSRSGPVGARKYSPWREASAARASSPTGSRRPRSRTKRIMGVLILRPFPAVRHPFDLVVHRVPQRLGAEGQEQFAPVDVHRGSG